MEDDVTDDRTDLPVVVSKPHPAVAEPLAMAEPKPKQKRKGPHIPKKIRDMVLTVRCPRCHSPAGDPCITAKGGVMERVHPARTRAAWQAQRQHEKAAKAAPAPTPAQASEPLPTSAVVALMEHKAKLLMEIGRIQGEIDGIDFALSVLGKQ